MIFTRDSNAMGKRPGIMPNWDENMTQRINVQMNNWKKILKV